MGSNQLRSNPSLYDGPQSINRSSFAPPSSFLYLFLRLAVYVFPLLSFSSTNSRPVCKIGLHPFHLKFLIISPLFLPLYFRFSDFIELLLRKMERLNAGFF